MMDQMSAALEWYGALWGGLYALFGLGFVVVAVPVSLMFAVSAWEWPPRSRNRQEHAQVALTFLGVTLLSPLWFPAVLLALAALPVWLVLSAMGRA